MKKLFMLILSVVLSLSLLVGCGSNLVSDVSDGVTDKVTSNEAISNQNGEIALLSNEEVIAKVEATIPNAEFVSVTHVPNDNEYGVDIYKFDNGDFRFQVCNYINTDNSNILQSDYFYRMVEKNIDDIKQLAEDNGIMLFVSELEIASYYTSGLLVLASTYPDNLIVSLDTQKILGTDSNINFNIVLNGYSHITSVYNFLSSFYEKYQVYFPLCENEELNFKMGYTINMNKISEDKHDPAVLYSDSFYALGTTCSIETEDIIRVQNEFLKLVDSGVIADKD